MSIRPSIDIRRGLRVTLHRLEQSLDSVEDAEALAELKRIVQLRIAELDAEALEQVAIESPTTRRTLCPKEISATR